MGSKYVYDDFLLGKMGRQLKLNLGQVKRLIRCPLTREEYIGILRAQGFLRQ